MSPDISTSVGPIALERPTMLASGILGISLDVLAVYIKKEQEHLSQNHLVKNHGWDIQTPPSLDYKMDI